VSVVRGVADAVDARVDADQQALLESKSNLIARNTSIEECSSGDYAVPAACQSGDDLIRCAP
jgi:hypothetical protein